MTNHPPKRMDDGADDYDERVENIARVVKDYLREGDAFLIECVDDEVLVEESSRSNFEKDHPRLYGRLLSLNEQMDSGCGLTLLMLVLGGLLVLALNVGWLDEVLGNNVVEHLKSWWFYVPLFVLLFIFSFYLYDVREKRIYRRSREELMVLLQNEHFDRDTLVPAIQDIPEFERIVKQLKLDPGPFLTEG